jgi:alpha-mannosidase
MARWAALLCLLAAPPARGETALYLANDNHTDYGWNASVAAYEAAMLAELDFYLARIAATAGAPPAEQARFAADCWYYVWLYEQARSPAQFAALVDAVASGHVSVPLNPLVILYGALPSEAAIRAGYYPGRLERRLGLRFPLAQDVENQTMPWGLASLWAGSGARFSWKGICACATQAPFAERRAELFHWQGPDGRTLLTKWYDFDQASTSWGGYAEARDHLSLAAMQDALDRFTARGHPVTGLFGYGWDDVRVETDAVVDAVRRWNDAHPGGPPAVVSNIVDYFEDLAARGTPLPTLRGGWGNEWDLWPATLAAPTADLRRAVERLRAGEALAAVLVADGAPAVWDAHRPALDAAWVDYFKYFEHTWGDGGAGLDGIVANKRAWAAAFVAAVEALTADAAAAFAARIETPPGEDRVLVFNPLAFARTDVVELAVDGPGPYRVVDLASGEELPSQMVGGALQIVVRDVPSLGYRVLRYAPGTSAIGDCCTVDPTAGAIANARWQVQSGAGGELTSLRDRAAGGLELAGAGGLNGGPPATVRARVAEDVGPVSATLRLELDGDPPRRVRIRLLREVDRVELSDELLERPAAPVGYRFAVAVPEPDLHFEEVGAVMRPGFEDQGGDFQPGARTDYVTLNHFLSFADPLGGYHVTLSNRDAFAARIGESSASRFDLPTDHVSVLAAGNVAEGGILDQGGDRVFRHDFALTGSSGAYAPAAALRSALAHQNPLLALPLPRDQRGPRVAAVASLLAVDDQRAVVTAVKPAEERARGVLVRLWNLAGEATTPTIAAAGLGAGAVWSTSLIETDRAPLASAAGRAVVPLAGGALAALRLGDAPPLDRDGLLHALFDPAPPLAADVTRDGATSAPDLSAF